jgi:hypothetical protein
MQHINDERRESPRHRVKAEFRVLMVATRTSAEGEEQALPLMGFTQDISENGVSLLVSAKSASVLSNLGETYTLQLVITVPTGPIDLEVTPARYVPLEDGSSGSRILIGARITKIRDEDRSRLLEYLSTIQQ